jgi:hypothetical protein
MDETARSPGGDPERVDIEQREQRPKRICLASIVHYYLLANANKSKDVVRRKQLAGHADIAERDLNQFIDKAAAQGANKLYGHFDGLIRGKDGGRPDPIFADRNLPEHIKVAIHNAYSDGDGGAEPRPSADEFNLDQVRDKDPKILSRIASAYTGVWRVIRYSAHATPGERPQEDKDGNVANAFTVLATAQISAPDPKSPNQDLRFEIHYQPREQGTGRHLTSRGSIRSLGNGRHVFFLGGEDTGYPICIFASNLGKFPARFRGLVLRRHEAGPIFAARAMFVRTSVGSIGELDAEIGTKKESDLKKSLKSEVDDIDELLEHVNNLVPNQGRHCLKLLESQLDVEQLESALHDVRRVRRVASMKVVRTVRRQSRSKRTGNRRKTRRRT